MSAALHITVLLVVCSAEEPPEHRSVQGLLGRSALIARLAYELSRVARSRLTVLLLGEPGVGKERAARGLQALSERRTFKALDCGALQGNLIESELFGHVRGAFSGALFSSRYRDMQVSQVGLASAILTNASLLRAQRPARTNVSTTPPAWRRQLLEAARWLDRTKFGAPPEVHVAFEGDLRQPMASCVSAMSPASSQMSLRIVTVSPPRRYSIPSSLTDSLSTRAARESQCTVSS